MTLRQIEIPQQVGTYLLILHANRPRRVTVGKLGQCETSEGFYCYVGSAFGAGGLKSRLGRHCRRDKTARWHIDYLRAKTALAGAYWSASLDKREDSWVSQLCQCGTLTQPFAGFGASDSKQRSHLFFSQVLLGENAICAFLGETPEGGLNGRFEARYVRS